MPERTLVVSGRVAGGKLKVRGWRGLQDWRDGEVTITIRRKTATRSTLQNAFYWGVLLRVLADHTGYTVDELHDYCKLRFNAERLVLCDAHGVVVDERRVGQTTTRLNKIDFGEYLERIRSWAAADLGVVIPDPDPDWRPATAGQHEAA